jgi:signal transduction histidine kinase
VFERFRHGPGAGTGLGLALVREIVMRHDGTVTLESHSAGTEVRVRLPLVARQEDLSVSAVPSGV